MKEFANGGKSAQEQFFGYSLSSARMVVECAFRRLKARFGCLRREIDMNMSDLPTVIHSCFTLHNFCEINNETINQQRVDHAVHYDTEFQQQTLQNVLGNEAAGKRIHRIFLKYFN